MGLMIYGVYTFLAVFNAGTMTTLQIQHYGIYPFVGIDNFKAYMKANNKAAFIPAVLPGLLLHILSIVLLFIRPSFMTFPEVVASLALNVIAFVSTFKWQRPIQEDMANAGYNEEKVKILLSTNWIRTIAFIILSIMTISVLIMAVS